MLLAGSKSVLCICPAAEYDLFHRTLENFLTHDSTESTLPLGSPDGWGSNASEHVLYPPLRCPTRGPDRFKAAYLTGAASLPLSSSRTFPMSALIEWVTLHSARAPHPSYADMRQAVTAAALAPEG